MVDVEIFNDNEYYGINNVCAQNKANKDFGASRIKIILFGPFIQLF